MKRPWILSNLLPKKVWVKVNARSLPSFFVAVVPPRVKTGVETQSPLEATVGSVVRMTFPFFTVNWIFRKAGLTACCVVLPLYLPVFTATPASATPGPRTNEGRQHGREEQLPVPSLRAIRQRPYRFWLADHD